MRKTILFLLVTFCVHFSQAQKSIVLEKFRCFSATGMTMSYFKDETVRRTFAIQLSKVLSQFHQLPLADSNNISVEYLNSIGDLVPATITYTDKENAYLHLYIDLFEMAPDDFFNFPDSGPTDTTIRQRARSVFLIKGSLLRADKTIAFSEQLNVVVSASQTTGMGIIYKYYSADGRQRQVVATPKGFLELLKASSTILFDPKNQLEMVEMKVSPAFFADNYITAKAMNQPRIFVTTTRNISSYYYKDAGEMIRMGDPVYEEILLRGKKAQKYPDDITAAIKQSSNYAGSDFVFLREECRDVIRDKNYLLKLTTQVNPEGMLKPPFTFTNFLYGNFHYLMLERDTIARFAILKKVPDVNKKISLNKVSNGNDTAFFWVNTANTDLYVIYDYVAEGMLNNQGFSIRCSGFTNSIKEIYLDKKLVCIAQGRFSPEKFVVFDASLSSELLSQLFMIGFNRFFE
ncbi:MAG: hypothetical protein V4557_00080 [Bacteroidota bacterium]